MSIIADATEKVQHSPGPWHYDGTIVTDGPGEDSGYVATPGDPTGCNPAEERANGYLIAAAPELLAACKAFHALFCDSDMQPEDECHDLFVIVGAAIAKAEGGTK